MNQWFRLAFFDPFIVTGICAALMLICLRLGYHRRRPVPAPSCKAQGEGARESGSPLIDEACLAILGLLLAFSFAAAYGKLDTRNGKIVDDANAIRTLYFRCQTLPTPHREQLQPLILDAVRQRLSLAHATLDPMRLQTLDAQARATEMKILSIIARMAQDTETAALAPPLADGCHDVVAAHEARMAAGVDHVPLPVIILLIFVASMSSYLLGRSEAAGGRLRRRTVALVLLVSAIVYVTMDLEQPLRGFIQANQAPIVRLAESLGVTD